MPEPCPPAQPDTPAVSLPQLTLSVRLCDYADCRKPLHKCARAWPAQETGKHDQATRTGEAMCVCGTSQVACSLPVDVGNELRVRRRCHRHTLLLRVGVGCCACRPR
jgi:hypothetical protein